ncbi:MAG: M1 family peptidase, partial [Bacteroidetes bacterium]|nr:M1 family peptidase [Bacteroidota bacterium]
MRINLKFIIIFVLLVQTGFSQLDFGRTKKFTKADSLRGTLSPLRSCYDVLFYDLDVRVDIDKKFISGSNTIKFLAKNNFQKLQIDLFENMKIEKIEFNNSANEEHGKELKYTRLFNAVFVEFPD